MRNLVVAATGAGKTVIAAFDYARQVPPSRIPPRLLFLAHRQELLEQARRTFRYALHDGAFGELLANRVALPEDTYPVPEWPLALHRHYSRREIAAAVGYVEPGDKGGVPQGGILKLPGKREVLLVTLDKSARTFSPTTRYRDYAISPTLFHWETQSIASVTRESGRRYVESPGNGWSFYLFVRVDRDSPYAFVGRVRYVSHERDRPIGITWEIETGLPAGLYGRFATLAVG